MRPPALRAHQKIGVVSVAGRTPPARAERALRTLEGWGLEVVLGPHAFDTHHAFAGTDARRADDLQAMLDAPDIRAIIATRGGYGTSRLIDRLDFSALRRAPKWIVGFSDVTVLHNHLHGLGLESLHAAMPVTFHYAGAEPSVETLRALLFGEEIHYQLEAAPPNRLGEATGALTGGNLSLLVHLIGTPSEVDTTGKILFIEDIGEYAYHLDRMMIQLKRAGKLAHLAGLIVGQMTDVKDREGEVPFGKTPYEIITEAVAEYPYPVCYHFPVGHEAVNWALPCGRTATLRVGEQGVSLVS
ncbi:MAG: LD-carboxypeptidase [Ferruginibacter sp.]|nr:LD-carboxypeptidase [Cytophagales bacterium]